MQKLKALFAPRDMTVGSPWKNILMFAVPLLLGNLVQQLYNAVDTAIVGQYVGDDAVAAVTSSMPIINLLLALMVGIATGTGIRVSQRYGAKDRKNLSLVIGNCLTLTLISSLIIMGVGIPLVPVLLDLLNTPTDIIEWTGQYLNIYLAGVSGAMFYNMLSGILRGLGDSLSALGFLIIAALLNVVLDLWFIIQFDMKVAGVALATILSQGVSAVLCFIKLKSMSSLFDINRKTLRLNKKTTLDMIKLGLPTGITQAAFSLAMLLIQRLENSFGPMFLATTGIVKRVDGFTMLPSFSFGSAMTTFIGQNVGAKKYDRLHQGAVQGAKLAFSTSVVLTCAILLFGRRMLGIFTRTQEVIDWGMSIMYILVPGYLAMGLTQTMSGVMRGAGDTVTPMGISAFYRYFSTHNACLCLGSPIQNTGESARRALNGLCFHGYQLGHRRFSERVFLPPWTLAAATAYQK